MAYPELREKMNSRGAEILRKVQEELIDPIAIALCRGPHEHETIRALSLLPLAQTATLAAENVPDNEAEREAENDSD